MTIYPIIIPTLNRYCHLKRCVESLMNCTHAENTELIIGLDYPPEEKYIDGYNQIKEYLPSIKGFKCVTIFERKENVGSYNNFCMLLDYALDKYGACIGAEDDCEFSPCFLDFMNKGLEKYEADERIISISGYNDVSFYGQGKHTTYLNPDNNVWGWGIWKHKNDKLQKRINDNLYFLFVLRLPWKAKKIIETYPALYSMLNTMVRNKLFWGDVRRTTLNILEGYYQLRPAISLVRNWGMDGSGEHCGVDDSFATQRISTERIFSFSDGVGPFETEANRKALSLFCLPKDPKKRENAVNGINDLCKWNTNVLYIIRRKINFRERLRSLKPR